MVRCGVRKSFSAKAFARILLRFAEPLILNMPAPTLNLTPRKPTARSRMTNGSRIHLFGDGRSTEARRYRDLLAQFSAELGGMAILSATAQQIVRRAAQTSVECELLEAARAAGRDVQASEYAAAANVNRRALRDMQALKAQHQPRALSLAEELMAEKRAREAAQAA